VWEQATAAARLAAELGSDLGLDPISHARIRALSSGAEAIEAAASLAELVRLAVVRSTLPALLRMLTRTTTRRPNDGRYGLAS
jgi:hypothetical protein